MPSNDPSLISGLDPAALFALADDASVNAPGDWQPPSVEEAAKLFPQWKVLGLLGRGGMGAVYHIRQPDLDREVAVKLLPIEASRNEHQVERFRREARVLAKLKHPGIVALHEAGMTPAGHFFFVMEHINGHPLSDLIAQGRMDVPRAIDIVRQVCDALAYAHGQGVVHRDIKPSNILIDALGHAKVADFGLAHWERAETEGALSLSRTGMFMGTPDYAAPEQTRDAAHVDHRADIYSLGVLLYELLTGELPRGVFQPPSRKAGSDARLDNVVQRALQERPEDRYQAASELKEDVSSVSAKPFASNPAGIIFAVVAVVLLAMIGSGVWFMWWMAGSVVATPVPGPSKPSVSTAPAMNGSKRPPSIRDSTAAANPSMPSVSPPEPAEESKQVPGTLATSKQAAKLDKPGVAEPASSSTPLPKTVAFPIATAPKATAKVWSINPLSPALSPPDEVMKLAWKDCVLLRHGGAVLLEDGQRLLLWNEAKPGVGFRYAHPVRVKALARSADHIALLDETATVFLLLASEVPSPMRIAEKVRYIFSSSSSSWIGGITKDGNALLWPTDPKDGVKQLPFINPSQLSVTSSRIIYARDSNDALMETDSQNPLAFRRVEARTTFEQIASVGDSLLAITKGGGLQVIGSFNRDVPSRIEAVEIHGGEDFAIARDAKNKLTIWGSSVPDSPQRMSMPEGTTHITVSPLGLIAAW